MRIPEELEKMLNEQVREELNAGYIYLAMAAWFESKNLPGFAKWMKAQSREEQGHAMKLFDYLNDRGSAVKLLALPGPRAEFKSAMDAFENGLAHERAVTARIGELYKLAVESGDTPSAVFLQWFVNEQVEEEKSFGDIISQLEIVKEDSAAILMLDRQLGQRE